MDLRFARGEEQLDLKNPMFLDVVADVASAMRGVPKDELESEEVRQHRRTVRTAWAAAVSLIVLVVFATVAAVFAVGQRGEALKQASLAAEQADVARSERDRAVVAEQDAETQRGEAVIAAEAEAAARVAADQAAALAQAREVVLEAEQAVQHDPELSIHLALFSIDVFRQAGEDPAQAVAALRAAIAANRIVFRLPSWEGPKAVAFHPDEPLLATAADGPSIEVWDLATHRLVETYGSADVFYVAFSPNGNLLAASGRDPEKVTIWNRATGIPTSITEGGRDLVFSPDGAYLAWWVESELVVEVWSLAERRVVYRSDGDSTVPDFGPTGLLVFADVFGGRTVVKIIEPASGRLIRSHPVDIPIGWHIAWSPDGSLIATASSTTTIVIDADTGAEVSRTAVDLVGLEWLPDSDALVVGGRSGLKVIDASSGEVRMELLGLPAGQLEFDISAGAPLLAATTQNEFDQVLIFDTSAIGGTEVAGWTVPFTDTGMARFVGDGSRVVVNSGGSSYISADSFDGARMILVDGPDMPTHLSRWDWAPTISPSGAFVAAPVAEGHWTVRATDTETMVYETPDHQNNIIQGVTADGSTAAVLMVRVPGAPCETTLLVSTLDGKTLGDISAPCSEGDFRERRFFFSSDGQLVLAAGGAGLGDSRLYDAETGRLLAVLDSEGTTGPVGAFTVDGKRLLVLGQGGRLSVLDVRALVDGSSTEEALMMEFSAHDTTPVGVSVSPDGSMAVTSAIKEPVRLWDLETGRLLEEFGGKLDGEAFHYADFHPSLPYLLVVSPPNEVRIYTLDLDELISIAEARLTREMTEEECQQYFFSPCTSQ